MRIFALFGYISFNFDSNFTFGNNFDPSNNIVFVFRNTAFILSTSNYDLVIVLLKNSNVHNIKLSVRISSQEEIVRDQRLIKARPNLLACCCPLPTFMPVCSLRVLYKQQHILQFGSGTRTRVKICQFFQNFLFSVPVEAISFNLQNISIYNISLDIPYGVYRFI